MLPLCASPARHEGAPRFFQAFYRWTRLGTRDHAHNLPPRPFVTAHLQKGARTYSSTEPVSPKDQSQETSPVEDAHPLLDHRQTVAVDPDYYTTLTANESELLRKVARFSRVRFALERSQSQKSSQRRIFLVGTVPAVKVAVDYIDSLRKHLDGKLPELPDIANPNIEYYAVGAPDKGVQKRARDLYNHAFDPDSPVHTRTRRHMFTRPELYYVSSLDEKTLSVIRLSSAAQTLDIELDPTKANRPHLRITGTKASVDKAIDLVKAFLQKERETAITSNFKLSMRAVPNPVAVLTAGHVKIQDDWEDLSQLRGMTVSSFTPVTLTPVPIISFNIRTPSRTLDVLDKFGDVTVHILASNSDGATIANAFTKPHDDPAEPFRNLHDMDRDINVYPRPSRPPQIVGPGVLTRLRCKMLLDKRLKIGDHVVVFAEVLSVIRGHGEDRKGVDADHSIEQGTASSTATALAYAHGKYCGVSETFEPETFVPAAKEEVSSSSSSTDESVSASAGYASEIPTETEPVPTAATAAEPVKSRSETSWTARTRRQYSTLIRPSTLLADSPTPLKNPTQSRSFSLSPSTQNENKSKTEPPSSSPSSSSPNLSTTIQDFLSTQSSSSSSSNNDQVGKSQKMRLRQKQKAFLEAALEKLEGLKQSGVVEDDEVFIARQFQIMTLRRDVIDNQLNEGQWTEFLEWAREAFAADEEEEEEEEEEKKGGFGGL